MSASFLRRNSWTKTAGPKQLDQNRLKFVPRLDNWPVKNFKSFKHNKMHEKYFAYFIYLNFHVERLMLIRC